MNYSTRARVPCSLCAQMDRVPYGVEKTQPDNNDFDGKPDNWFLRLNDSWSRKRTTDSCVVYPYVWTRFYYKATAVFKRLPIVIIFYIRRRSWTAVRFVPALYTYIFFIIVVLMKRNSPSPGFDRLHPIPVRVLLTCGFYWIY